MNNEKFAALGEEAEQATDSANEAEKIKRVIEIREVENGFIVTVHFQHEFPSTRFLSPKIFIASSLAYACEIVMREGRKS